MQNAQKPSKALRIKYNTDYSKDNIFAAWARILQSIWREEKGFPKGKEKYGNYLDFDFAKKHRVNFLTSKIKELVKAEVANKGKVIQEPRIWDNLLSSQPMAFNLFGEMKAAPSRYTGVFDDLLSERNINKITAVEFEYSPGRRNLKYTGDNSAFDVFVTYRNESGQNGFLGIEVKYAEHMNDRASTDKDRYEEIARESGLFNLSKLDQLKERPVQQIWRDHLLALSLFKVNSDYDVGDFIFLYPKDNNKCATAIELYQSMTKKYVDHHLKPITLEQFMEVLKKHSKEKWVADFEDRYLNFNKITE